MEPTAFLRALAGVAILAAIAEPAVAAPIVVHNPAGQLPRPEERKPAIDTDGRIGGVRIERAIF